MTTQKITRENLYIGFKVLFGYLSRYRKEIILLSTISIVSALANAFVPYLIGRFFDALTTTESFSGLGVVLPLFWAIFIAITVVQLIAYAIDWKINTMSEYLSNTIWIDYLSRGFGFLFELPLSFHKKHKMGEVADKIHRASHALESVAGKIVINLAPQMLSIIVAIAIAFSMRPLFALFLILGISVYLVTMLRSVQPLGDIQSEYWNKISSIWGDSYDNMTNTLSIKQATAEKHESVKLKQKFGEAVPLWLRMTKIWANLTLYQRLSILLTQSTIFIFSIIYIRAGTMSLGELISFYAYATMVFGPFVTLAQNWQTIHMGVINLQETEKLLSTPTEIYSPKDSKPFSLEGNISFRNVAYHYEEGKPVLRDISFEVRAGEAVALVGESGVGKSTLIDLIGAYNFPTGGNVLIDGTETDKLDLVSLRSQIAVVPQEIILFNDTVRTNIKYGNLKAGDEELEAAAKKAHAIDFIEKFPEKWEQIVGERGIKLSVGQKQRIAIARAILRNPKILILDEPTSALDAGSEKIITESLETLMKGKTTFIIAHRLSTVRKANKILVFKEGRVVESGTHQELLKIEGGEYRRLYELQIGLHD
jgi:ABC-type multidrug transport system fused ATPase/permease subunit